MFFQKIFHFLKGYVILSVWGNDRERFIDELTGLGIVPRNLKNCNNKIFFEVSLSEFFMINNAVYRPRLHIEKKCGALFFIKKLKKRWAFLSGIIAVALIFFAGSEFIWTIEYEGVEGCNKEMLERAVELSGIKRGMLKKNLAEPLEVKDIILAHTDDLAWAFPYVKGTKLIISVRENIRAPEVFDLNTPCDIIASRWGIIKRVIPTHGKAMVTEGQMVSSGDVIISGTYNFGEKEGYRVHASGIVEAYTEHVKTGTYKQYYCYREYTGRKRNFLVLKFFAWDIPLYFSEHTDFEAYEKEVKEYDARISKNNYIGVGLRRITYLEYIEKKEPISYDAAVEFAKKELEQEIAKELLAGAVLQDENVEAHQIDEETLSVKLTMNFIEQIGTEKHIEEVEIVEPKTDRDTGGI